MSQISRLIIVVAATLPLSQPALANKVTKLNLSAQEGFADAPVLRVYSSNGERWDTVDKTAEISFRVGLNAKCKYQGRGNKAYEGKLWVSGFSLLGKHEPANFLIPDVHEASGTFRFDDGVHQPTSPVQVCADELTKRLSQNADLSKYHLLAKGFTVNYPAAFEVKFGLTCNPTGLGFSDYRSKGVLVNARIRCAASDLAKQKLPKPKLVPKAAVLVPLIKSVSFAADPSEYTGTCPVGVSFTGKITAARAGTVKYRYVSHDGKISPELTLDFSGAGTRATREWHRTLAEPDPSGTLSVGGQPGKWDHSGWYRIEILSPQGQQGVQASYRVDCTKPSKARVIKIK